MRDRPDGYLFNDIKDCCKEHFYWDPACGFVNPSRTWYYPKYDEATCYEKKLSEFDLYDTEKYATKNACCLEKFSNNILSCCNDGEGDCELEGTSLYIPDWTARGCQERDTGLVLEWENDWTSTTMEECCEKCKCHQIIVKCDD